MAEFLLPDVGEGLTEAEIVSWRVKEGDTVKINDIVVEIETAKSLVELPSPYAGTVTDAAGARGRDRPRRHADHLDRRPAPQRRRRRRRAGDARPSRLRDGDRPLQPGRQRRRRGREPGRPQQGRPRPAPPRPQGSASPAASTPAPPPRCRLQGAFAPGGAQSRGRSSSADEPAVPAASAADRRARPAAAPGAGEAAGAQARQGPRHRPRHAHRRPATGGVITRARRGGSRRRRRLLTPSDDRPARPPAPAGRPASARRREPIKGVRKMMAQAMVSRPSPPPCHRVDHRRRRPATMEFVERLKQPGASSATSRSRRCWSWPGR